VERALAGQVISLLLGIAGAIVAHVVRRVTRPRLRRRPATHTITPREFALPIELIRMIAANGEVVGSSSGVGGDGRQLRGERRGQFLRSDLLGESRHIVASRQWFESWTGGAYNGDKYFRHKRDRDWHALLAPGGVGARAV
jgi:hypothetical protein